MREKIPSTLGLPFLAIVFWKQGKKCNPKVEGFLISIKICPCPRLSFTLQNTDSRGRAKRLGGKTKLRETIFQRLFSFVSLEVSRVFLFPPIFQAHAQPGRP